MKSGLESRVIKLEQAAEAGEIVYVRTVRANGEIVPLKPGQRYGAYVAELPEVCATAEEWQVQCRPTA